MLGQLQCAPPPGQAPERPPPGNYELQQCGGIMELGGEKEVPCVLLCNVLVLLSE